MHLCRTEECITSFVFCFVLCFTCVWVCMFCLVVLGNTTLGIFLH